MKNKKILLGSIIVFAFVLVFAIFAFINNKEVKAQNILTNTKCRIKKEHHEHVNGCYNYNINYEYLDNGNTIKSYKSYKYKTITKAVLTLYASCFSISPPNILGRIADKTIYDKDNKILYEYFKNTNHSNKYVYNAQGKVDTIYRYCDKNASNCSHMDKYKYDNKGNNTELYENCDINFETCRNISKTVYNAQNKEVVKTLSFHDYKRDDYKKYVYGENDNVTEYLSCDKNFENCLNHRKYKRNKNNQNNQKNAVFVSNHNEKIERDRYNNIIFKDNGIEHIKYEYICD